MRWPLQRRMGWRSDKLCTSGSEIRLWRRYLTKLHFAERAFQPTAADRAVLGRTLTYTPGESLGSLTIFDYWTQGPRRSACFRGPR